VTTPRDSAEALGFIRGGAASRINHAGASGCVWPTLNAHLTVLHHCLRDPAHHPSSRKNCGPHSTSQEDRLRTLLICALATTLVGCSSQQSSQPSCVGLNPFACLTAVHVPIESESYESDSATPKPEPAVVRRADGPPRSHADHAVRRTPRPTKVVAKAAIPVPVPSPQASQQTTGNAGASQATRATVTDPQSTADVPPARTTEEQVAAASAVAERMSVPTLDTSLDTLVAVLVAGPDIKSVSDLAGKTISIDDRYSESSISRVRTAMAAAGAPEIQLSKGQTTAISRLVAKEVPAAVVGLISVSAADSFPELARLRTFRVPLSPRSSNKQP
jgi:hypothetical protein